MAKGLKADALCKSSGLVVHRSGMKCLPWAKQSSPKEVGAGSAELVLIRQRGTFAYAGKWSIVAQLLSFVEE